MWKVDFGGLRGTGKTGKGLLLNILAQVLFLFLM